MPPRRDEQEYQQKRQQIIDAALHVFAGKGFEKATNRDIARQAGVASPGLIYHYFKDKADLFRQVMHERAPVLQLLDRGDDLMDLPPRVVLTTIGTAFLQTMRNRHAISMIKMMLGEAVRRPAVAEMMANVGPARGIAFVARYLTHQMEKGTLKKVDASVAARCFMGPLAAHVIMREVFTLPDSASISDEVMLQTTVEIFLRGMEFQYPKP